MKRLIPVLLVCVMLLALVAAPVSANKGKSFSAEYGTPALDGKIEDLWAACEATVVDLPHNGDNKGSTDKATVKALWDETGLYFLVEAKDSDYQVDKEIFEFYFDEVYDKSEKYNKNDRQSRLYVSTGIDKATGILMASAKDEDGNDTSRPDLFIGSGSAKTSDGWILEAGFKWTGNNKIGAGSVLGCEFMWDDPGAGLALRWNVDTAAGDTAPYQSTKDFGALTLKEEIIEEVVEETKAAAEAPKTTTSAATADPITAAIAVVALLGTGVVLGKKRK